jgi:hypothetical protein
MMRSVGLLVAMDKRENILPKHESQINLPLPLPIIHPLQFQILIAAAMEFPQRRRRSAVPI